MACLTSGQPSMWPSSRKCGRGPARALGWACSRARPRADFGHSPVAFPGRRAPGSIPRPEHNPAMTGWVWRGRTLDQERGGGWLGPAGARLTEPEARGLLLRPHGDPGSVVSCLPMTKQFREVTPSAGGHTPLVLMVRAGPGRQTDLSSNLGPTGHVLAPLSRFTLQNGGAHSCPTPS